MSGAASKITTGQVVDGKYRIGRQLGQGGMGAVYEAIHLGTNRRVALKVIVSEALANEPGVVARFEREARASGAIDSTHVVQVLDTGIDPTTTYPYMVMEYLSGEDVSDLVHRVGPLPPELVARIGAQACLGLQRAHDAGIIHRDIKSANLFLARRDGGDVHVKVLDFGIAKVRADPLQAGQDHGLTRTGSMLGSPLYMSPEQARGAKTIDGRSDVWSLGIVLFEALVGETPFHDKETLGDLLVAICVEPLPLLQDRAPWIAPGIADVVERALARDPAARFASARDMYEALAALVPDGVGIRESMLGPVTAEMRARVAARVDRTVAMSPQPPGRSTPPLGVTPGGGVMQRSDPGVPQVHPSSPPGVVAGSVTASDLGRTANGSGGGGKKTGVVVLGVVAVLGLGAVVATRGRTSMTEALGKEPPVGLVQPQPSATVMKASPEPAIKRAKVTVTAPAGATVHVDGERTEIHEGEVEVSGAPGTQHKVSVKAGDDAQDFDVMILATGKAMPATLELAPKKKPAGGKPAGSAAASGAKPAATGGKPGGGKPAGSGEPGFLENF